MWYLMTCPNNWKQLCLETSTTIPIDISSKILQDNWLNAKERELKYNARQKEQRIRETYSLEESITPLLSDPEKGEQSMSFLEVHINGATTFTN